MEIFLESAKLPCRFFSKNFFLVYQKNLRSNGMKLTQNNLKQRLQPRTSIHFTLEVKLLGINCPNNRISRERIHVESYSVRNFSNEMNYTHESWNNSIRFPRMNKLKASS